MLSIAAASLALALVHPTYAFFVAVPLAGFSLRASCWRRVAGAEAVRVAAALPAVLLPAGLYALWLKPIVDQTVSHGPDAAERAQNIHHYSGTGRRRRGLAAARAGGDLTRRRRRRRRLARDSARGFRGAASLVCRTFSAARSPCSASCFSRGRSTISRTPSRSRRRAGSRPSCRLPFAVAGAASLVGRLRLAGCLAAFGAGGAYSSRYPGEFSYALVVGGPSWPVWVAFAGAAVGLIVAAVVRRGMQAGPPLWTAAVALSLVAPVALAGMVYLKQDEPDRFRLTPGLVEALRTDVRPRDVVFSDLETSYRIEGYAPVYVAAAPPAHVADTIENKPDERRRAVIDFLGSGNLAIPRRYDADWIVVATHRFHLELPLPKVYEDDRFVLYRLSRRS